nr:hypothetical protein [Streptomyces sp. SID8373]
MAGGLAGQIVRQADDAWASKTLAQPSDQYDPEEAGTQIVRTRSANGVDQGLSRRREVVDASDDYDPEDVQFAARTDDGDVVMYLPEITYLDTQPWSVEIGLTPDRLVQLRDALDRHLRGAADHAGPVSRGDTPTIVVQQTTVATPSGGVTNGSRSDIATTAADSLSAANGGMTPGHAVVGLQPTTLGQQPTVAAPPEGGATDSVPSGASVVAQQATVAREVERLRGIVARCQSLADWLTRHSSLGVDMEADSIRRAIGDRLRTALDPSARPAEWEAQ